MVRNVVSRWLGTAGLVVLMASVASAQQQQRRGGGGGPGAGGAAGGGKVAIVQMDRVQEELKLTDDQKSKVAEIAERVQQARPQRGQDGAGQATREQQRERMQALARVVAEEEKKLDEALNEDQQKRLNEISIQLAGARALVREDVAGKLELSDDQKEKIQAALRAQRGQAGRGQGQQPGDAAAQRERRQQLEQEVMEVLTAEQKQKLDELKGEPFQRQARRGGGGQRRGPQN